ncbi:MAG: DUF2088 domain-containing protein, partial [Spirochaetales bacterium]|nr:DUF2088 domain-containing protein [Spirochaetales bacterium]
MIGWGCGDKRLEEKEALLIIENALSKMVWERKKVLLILPDSTRTAPVDLLYKGIFDKIQNEVECVDAIIALGTHQPMPLNEIFKRVCITEKEYSEKYSNKTIFFNHEWDNTDALIKIGKIKASEVREITGGMMDREVEISINRLIFNYDLLMVLGPVYPHEIVGFSGGNKYFFPGICGMEILNMFHWLGGLISNAVINGTKDTPVRDLINRSAEFIDIPRLYFNMVVKQGTLYGLFVGDGINAWGKAADLSAKVNVHYTGRRYKK